MPRYLLPSAVVLTFLHLCIPSPAKAQEREGSVPAAVVGGLVGGAVSLWSFYPLTGCPMITVGAARAADACDVGGVLSAVGGLGVGVWAGASDRGAGYGMALGAAAGFGAGWLLNRVADPPRWLNALLLVGGTVAGGLIGAADGDEDPLVQPASAMVTLGVVPVG